MGTYRLEVTFDLSDEALNDLVVQRTGALPDGWPEGMALTDDQRINVVTSALSLPNGLKVYNLVSGLLSTTPLVAENSVGVTDLQVVDLADPDAPRVPPTLDHSATRPRQSATWASSLPHAATTAITSPRTS